MVCSELEFALNLNSLNFSEKDVHGNGKEVHGMSLLDSFTVHAIFHIGYTGQMNSRQIIIKYRMTPV